MKITYIISDINKAISFEWIASHFYNNSNIKLNFIFLGCDNSDTVNFFRLNNYSFHLVPCANKIHWPFAFISILKILKATKPDIVHCHLLTANILGLCAYIKAGSLRLRYKAVKTIVGQADSMICV
jgi:hypothetical protein